MMTPVRRQLAVTCLEERSTDARELARARHLLDVHALVHELMVREAPLSEVLAAIVRGIEGQTDGMRGSVLLLDPKAGTLRHGAAPHLPPAYCAAIDGIAAGPGVGSCGTAAHTGEEVIAADIGRDPRWRDFRALAAEHGLGACWSVPIRDAGDAVLGTFALYASQPRAPREGELELIRRAGKLAAIAIERHRATEQLRRLATRDLLTGLPNRALLEDRLAQAIARCARSERAVAVVCADLDRFKLVNDSLGHEAGDWLLREVAQRLACAMRPGDTVARFGADEFVIVAEGMTLPDARRLASRLHEVVRPPFHHRDRGEHRITISLGISLAGYGDDPQEALRRAGSALYEAKRNGVATRLYSAELRRRATDQLRLDAALRGALERDELALHYQPIVCLADGRTTGYEALMRWRHPELGEVPPGRFIPLAEEHGLILAMGDWALATAAAQARTWSDRGLGARIAVNVSGRQLADPQLPARFERILAAAGAEPGALLLEVTETALIEHDRRAAASLHALAHLGLSITLDDFGTGYASFSHLRSLPIDIVKIDREFIAGLGVEDDATAIVAAIIGLAGGLGLEVVAEGVETSAQRDLLRELGCTSGQGYLWARPLPAEQVVGWSAAGR